MGVNYGCGKVRFPSPVPVGAREQHRPEAQREHLGLDAGPAPDDVMSVLVDGDDDRERHDEGQQREGEIALGVDIHAQHPGAPLMQPADQGGSHGGFSHAAFLICDGNDL